jgi:hypothetical protein
MFARRHQAWLKSFEDVFRQSTLRETAGSDVNIQTRAGRIRSRKEAAGRAGDSGEAAVLSEACLRRLLGGGSSSSDSDMLADVAPLSWTGVMLFGHCSVCDDVGPPGESQGDHRRPLPGLGRFVPAVIAFAIGCGAAAFLYIAFQMWCFLLPPLAALLGIATHAANKEFA